MKKELLKEKKRWVVWALAALVLGFSGRSLLHLKHMEWFMLLFVLGSAGLVLVFRLLRDR